MEDDQPKKYYLRSNPQASQKKLEMESEKNRLVERSNLNTDPTHLTHTQVIEGVVNESDTEGNDTLGCTSTDSGTDNLTSTDTNNLIEIEHVNNTTQSENNQPVTSMEQFMTLLQRMNQNLEHITSQIGEVKSNITSQFDEMKSGINEVKFNINEMKSSINTNISHVEEKIDFNYNKLQTYIDNKYEKRLNETEVNDIQETHTQTKTVAQHAIQDNLQESNYKIEDSQEKQIPTEIKLKHREGRQANIKDRLKVIAAHVISNEGTLDHPSKNKMILSNDVDTLPPIKYRNRNYARMETPVPIVVTKHIRSKLRMIRKNILFNSCTRANIYPVETRSRARYIVVYTFKKKREKRKRVRKKKEKYKNHNCEN